MPLPPHVQARRECLSFVVLGANGNLAQRKLLPSLFNLFCNNHLPPKTLIVCGGRPDHTDASFREITARSLREFLNAQPRATARDVGGGGASSPLVTRQRSLAAGIDDLDAEFRAALGGGGGGGGAYSPRERERTTTRDIGGCALTTARSSSFANLASLDATGNTDDQTLARAGGGSSADGAAGGAPERRAGVASASPLGRKGLAPPREASTTAAEASATTRAPLLAASQASPDFLVDDFLSRVRYARVASCETCGDALECTRGVFALVDAHEAEHADCPGRNRLFYFALPHELYLPVADAVHRAGRSRRPPGWTRVVVEKPFGSDLASAREMHAALAENWAEKDLYRIDRYLGKEVIDNLLVMRFANRLLTPIWNRENVANVQIVYKEPVGTTAEYFDKHGIVRDVMQNHLLQVMAVLAMDRPVSLDPEDIRDAKLKVLRQVTRVDPERDVVAGQYAAAKGRPGYRENASVGADSRTPTYAMVVLNVRNERWDGVPFILKAGKALNERRSEIRVQLRSTPGDIFAADDGVSAGRAGTDPGLLGAGPNEFVLRIQPREEMYMKLTIKEPGLGVQPVPSEMELSGRWRAEQRRKELAGEAPRRAYERLVLDVINGHQAHFVRGDELEAAWAIVDPINVAIETGAIPVRTYPFGSRGPPEADELRRSTGHVACAVPRDGGPALSSSDDYLHARGGRRRGGGDGGGGGRRPPRGGGGGGGRRDADEREEGRGGAGSAGEVRVGEGRGGGGDAHARRAVD